MLRVRSHSLLGTRLRAIAAVSALLLAHFAVAADVKVYRPSAGDHVVLKLSGGGLKQLAALKGAVERAPNSVDALARYVAALMAVAQRTGNERYYGFAERALLDAPEAVSRSLALTHAHLLQSRHDFAGAEAMVTDLLRRDSRHGEALLMRAQLRIHLNKPTEAMSDCIALTTLQDLTTATACIAQARGALGDIERALALIVTILDRELSNGSSAHKTRSWAASVAAELAARLGRDDHATKWYRVAYESDPQNHFARISYADWLLALGDNRRAYSVAVTGNTAADRLRVLLADGDPQQADARQLLLAWREADRRGERDHLRDRAKFELLILRDASRAHATAIDNFADHRSTEDALLLAQTATRVDDTTALALVHAWREERHYRDARLDRLLSGKT